jgi:hypothetical protein
MAKTKPSLVSIGTFWLISFARGANLSRRIVSGFSVPSSPFIPWYYYDDDDDDYEYLEERKVITERYEEDRMSVQQYYTRTSLGGSQEYHGPLQGISGSSLEASCW